METQREFNELIKAEYSFIHESSPVKDKERKALEIIKDAMQKTGMQEIVLESEEKVSLKILENNETYDIRMRVIEKGLREDKAFESERADVLLMMVETILKQCEEIKAFAQKENLSFVTRSMRLANIKDVKVGLELTYEE